METTALQTIQSLDVQGAANLLTEYTGSLEKAKVVVENLLKLDYDKAKYDPVIQGLKTRSSELETKRKPFTAELNAVVKLFTAAEKGFLELAEPLLAKEKAWKRAELEKQQAENVARQKEADRIRLVAAFVPKVESMLIDLKHEIKCDILDRMTQGEEVPAFEFTNDTWQGLCRKAMLALGAGDFKDELVAAIAGAKEKMLVDATLAIHEFQTECNKSKGNTKALQSIGRTLGVSYQEAVVQAADNAAAAKVEAEMEIAETAQVAAPEVVIGTKFIPTPQNHKEVLEIFRYWLATENPTVEDAAAQIGKAMTFCKRKALKGERLSGVTYIEDVK